MYIKSLVLAIAVLLFLILIQCSTSTSNNDPQTGDYFPLEIGNKWTFVYAVGGEQRELELTITDSKEIENKEYYVFDSWLHLIPQCSYMDITETLVRKNENGDLVIRIDNEDVEYFRFSDTTLYEMRFIPTTHTTFAISLSSIQDIVSTPSGRYLNCYRYSTSDSNWVDCGVNVSFSPNDGPVEFVQVGDGSTEYKLKEVVLR